MRSEEPVTGRSPLTMPSLPGFSQQTTPMLVSAIPTSGNIPTVALPPPPKAWVLVIPELCKGCELCVYACPSGNLSLSLGLNSKGYHPVVFSYDGKRGPCTACGICYWVCPDMAISEIRRLKR